MDAGIWALIMICGGLGLWCCFGPFLEVCCNACGFCCLKGPPRIDPRAVYTEACVVTVGEMPITVDSAQVSVISQSQSHSHMSSVSSTVSGVTSVSGSAVQGYGLSRL